MTNPLQQTTKFSYNQAGRRTQKTLPDGRTVQFGYDQTGNRTKVVPPGRPAHTFEYDGQNQLTRYSPPAVGGVQMPTDYHYNAVGELTKVDYPDGATLKRTFDKAGRLAKTAAPSATRNYSYANKTGQLSKITSGTDPDLTYSYDGSLRTQTKWSGAVSGSVSRSYDDSFRIQSRSVNQSHQASFSYDKDSKVTRAGGMTVTRDPKTGFVTNTSIGVVTTSKSYNNHGELTKHVVQAAGTTVWEATYNRDPLGSIKRVTEFVEGTTTTREYSYDKAGRLVAASENGSVRWRYTYDKNGNRLKFEDLKQGITERGTYDAQDRTKKYAGTSYDWTKRGDLDKKTTAQGKTTDFDYDIWGNLRTVQIPGGDTIDYVVDPKNRRIGKQVNGQFKRGWLYDDQLTIVAELGPNKTVQSRFVYATKSQSPDLMKKNGTTYRYVTDPRGSVRLLVDTSNGNVVQRMDYSPYGRVLQNQSGRMQPFGFAGGLWDETTRLVRFGARDYSGRSGAWNGRDVDDTAKPFDALNYSANDPVNLNDPRGTRPKPASQLTSPSPEPNEEKKRRAGQCPNPDEDDPVERCKEFCYKEYQRCCDRCDSRPCYEQCGEEYSRCLLDCEKRYD